MPHPTPPRRWICGIVVLGMVLLLIGSLRASPNISRAQPSEPTPTIAPSEASAPLLPVEDLGSQTTPVTGTVQRDHAIAAALRDFATRDPQHAPQELAKLPPPAVQSIAQTRWRVYLPMVRGIDEMRVDPPVPTATPRPRPNPDDSPPADVTVTTVVSPSIRVARGGRLVVELQLYNDGRGDANQTSVTLRFDPRQMLPISSRLDRRAGDWVSDLERDSLTVTFGELDDRSRRFGQVIFLVNTTLLDGTRIDVRPTFDVRDGRGTSEHTSNWAPVLVGGGNDTAAYVWMVVDPLTGTRNDQRTFFSNRYVPGEQVVAWLNTPGGTVRALDLSATIGDDGGVSLNYRPRELAPGTYQLVMYGQSSRITGVVSFTVR